MKTEVEIWKDVIGFEGYYQVSNLGRLKTCQRKYISKDNRNKVCKEIIRKNCVATIGYVVLRLSKNGVNTSVYLHRLVAESFLNNPENKPEVNHKNGIKTDNHVENLEWCTAKENSQHSVLYGLRNPATGVNNAHYGKFGEDNHSSKRVRQLSLISGELIMLHGGISEASRMTGVDRTNISAVCKGKRKSGSGYKWEYV